MTGKKNVARISKPSLDSLRNELLPLIGSIFPILSIPEGALSAFEPSQIGTIVGSLMDACIPCFAEIEGIPDVGIKRQPSLIGEREGYPDYLHRSSHRAELKLLYIDNPEIKMKKPPTAREPSARLTQKVTVRNVNPLTDVMLLIAYKLARNSSRSAKYSPQIISLEVFPMIDLVNARDQRMVDAGGRWFGNYETPTILSRVGAEKRKKGAPLDVSRYGRKESEGCDFNEDTNFGKLKRIPYRPLQEFLKLHGAEYSTSGTSKDPWKID